MITLPSSRAASFTFRPVPPGVKWSWMSASMTSLTEPRSAATLADLVAHLVQQEPDVLRVRGSALGRGQLVDLRRLLLAVAVDAADPLLQPGRVERDVEVDQPVAVGLQVDALAGGVGGDQDADLLLVRRGGELRADVLPFLGGR